MTLRHDPWLSGLLGKPSYHLGDGDSGTALAGLPGGEAFVDAKVPVADVPRLVRLQDAGFRVIDTNVQLARAAGPLGAGDTRARFAAPDDAAAVRELAAAAFVQSRFYLDPLISDASASRVKAEWAGNFFAGKRGDWMVVAEEDSAVAGFLQLLRGDDSVVIDLIAVAPGSRGRGIARSMIAFAASRCLERDAALTVGTQIGNPGSLALYESLGFSVVSAQYVLHLHRGDPIS